MPNPPLPAGRAGGAPPFFVVWRTCALLGLLLAGPRAGGARAATAQAPPKAAVAVGPGRTAVQFAKGFAISYAGNYKLITVRSPFEPKTAATRYLLVPRGAPRPAGYAGALLIETPVRSLVALSSLHVALADFLGAADVLVGVGDFKYVSAPRVRQRIAAGRVYEVGQSGGLNNELLIARRPDLVMASGWPGEGLGHFRTLAAAGIPVLINSEWVETTPLARAEWVKVLAVLLNKEDLVNRKFGQVARDYQRLAAVARAAPGRPKVVVGLPFKDVWYVPAANNYLAHFLYDAGCAYPWDHTTAAAGSLALSFEAVAPVALAADYWLQTGTATRRAGLVAQDARYAAFAPFKAGRVYNNNRRTNAQGSNDYWESGAVRPDLVLADLIKILHPGLLPTWRLYYYQLLP
ncbi:ABC transporter substrate-binding protein [Hymenobacter caeli]|uniref:Iron complex transport system substrate-binding protein n=1 Tax=Hymenobacter caeli TaxID=2735894 RepID=A0ABX2FKG2_9BACT|nr:ABC transporter substrate-binding protein [Hymenobacter caeli]NRT17610.1 iron complex transport system substrate-binding protein [Hymenobacter caeli]